MLGTILQAPESVQINAGEGEATFTCRAVGNVVWSINDVNIVDQNQLGPLAEAGINVPPSTPSESTVRIAAFESLNGTTVQCLVFHNMSLLSSTDTVQLLVFPGKFHFIVCMSRGSYSVFITRFHSRGKEVVGSFPQLLPHKYLSSTSRRPPAPLLHY